MPRDLSVRNRQPEIMDSPDLPPDRLARVYAGLSVVNAATFAHRILWPEIRSACERHPNRVVRVLDVACGGGDVLIRLWRRAVRTRLPVAFAGCDMSPVALAETQRAVRAARAGIEYFRHEFPRDGMPAGYDVIMCSLFLHHLDDAEAVGYLREASRRAADSVIVHDLLRSTAGFWFARLGTGVLLLSDICRSDGERSVEGAFSITEVRRLAAAAGLKGAVVEKRFPFRYVLRWVRR